MQQLLSQTRGQQETLEDALVGFIGLICRQASHMNMRASTCPHVKRILNGIELKGKPAHMLVCDEERIREIPETPPSDSEGHLRGSSESDTSMADSSEKPPCNTSTCAENAAKTVQ